MSKKKSSMNKTKLFKKKASHLDLYTYIYIDSIFSYNVAQEPKTMNSHDVTTAITIKFSNILTYNKNIND